MRLEAAHTLLELVQLPGHPYQALTQLGDGPGPVLIAPSKVSIKHLTPTRPNCRAGRSLLGSARLACRSHSRDLRQPAQS